MIVEAVCNVLFLIVTGIISIFPAFPHFEFDHLNGVVRVLSLVDTFVSLRVFGVCMVVILTVYNIQVIWAAIMWCVRKIPFLK